MEEVCGWEGEGGELRRAGEERGKKGRRGIKEKEVNGEGMIWMYLQAVN